MISDAAADLGDGFWRCFNPLGWLAICVLAFVASPNSGQSGRFSVMASPGDRWRREPAERPQSGKSPTSVAARASSFVVAVEAPATVLDGLLLAYRDDKQSPMCACAENEKVVTNPADAA